MPRLKKYEDIELDMREIKFEYMMVNLRFSYSLSRLFGLLRDLLYCLFRATIYVDQEGLGIKKTKM